VTTFFDMSADSAAASWRAIRTLRAAPSEALSRRLKGDRADVFHMALEQSQQQFAAAQLIGYESRPLNLFYGLSQAGRAIAAASDRLGSPHSKPWRAWLPTSHGLDFETTLSSAHGLLGQPIRVAPSATDSFSRLLHALGGPADLTSTTFGAVVAALPEVFLQFRRIDLGPVALLPHGLSSLDMVFFPTRWEIEAPGLVPQNERTVENTGAWQSQYPALRALELELNDAGQPQASNNPGYLYLTLSGADQLAEVGSARFPIGAEAYRNSVAILPRLGDATAAPPPLALWWMLLFALSMLARYSPRDWASVMDLRHSPTAPLVEFVLDTAIDAVPNLIAEALSTLNTTP
jgi:hypothetical protein